MGPIPRFKLKLRYSPIQWPYLKPSVTYFSDRQRTRIDLEIDQIYSYTNLYRENIQQKYRNRVSECSSSPLSAIVSTIIAGLWLTKGQLFQNIHQFDVLIRELSPSYYQWDYPKVFEMHIVCASACEQACVRASMRGWVGAWVDACIRPCVRASVRACGCQLKTKAFLTMGQSIDTDPLLGIL